MTYYLAVDIGASSGRHILGHLEDGRLCLEEIYRFENHLREQNGSLTWDIDTLVKEVKQGLAECARIGKIPSSCAIDTWGVDYVLLDENKKEILPVYAYRDSRTEGVPQEIAEILPPERLYALTGIQKQNFNTIYQLWCDKKSGRLSRAKHLLMMPEYLSWRLCGVMANEYTNATTGGLIDAEEKNFSTEILETLGYPKDLFLPLSVPGQALGSFTKEVQEEVGFNALVLLAPSHDTASAVAAIPVKEDSIYISSGTWSLIGTENTKAVLTPEARKANFTNEGGVEYRFRFLKNIMGMWLFQGIRRELDKKISYDEMMHLAMESSFTKTFDPNHPSLVAPKSMLSAIRRLLGKEDLPLGDLLASVYHSLAASYKKAVKEIEEICGKKICEIHIVGGGSKDAYLNRLTAKATGLTVRTGLLEATATGNLLSQIIHEKKLSLNQARDIIINTFSMKEVTP
ncbi:MAG: rhamnulokinase [Clostridia bacterium]|nr:rhamnulokinase [Clostridia bacterium]